MGEHTIAGLSPDKACGLAEPLLGYTFADKLLLAAALTHPSAAMHTDSTYNYERLEFLGDSILGAIVADELFERYPDLEEGGLTRIKVTLVSGTMLSKVAADVGLQDVIIFGESEAGTDRRGLHSALENVYESLVAALFLDGGWDAARAWIEATLFPYMDESIAGKPENPKSSLQEVLQAHQKHPSYAITKTEGPPHDRTFHADVAVDGEVLGSGTGRSKKEAEAAAASAALEALA